MSYVDQLLDEVDHKASSLKQEMVNDLFDKISSSVAGVISMRDYITLKKDLKFMARMKDAIEWGDEWADEQYHLRRYYELLYSNKVKRAEVLAFIRENSKGIRRLKREILESV